MDRQTTWWIGARKILRLAKRRTEPSGSWNQLVRYVVETNGQWVHEKKKKMQTACSSTIIDRLKVDLTWNIDLNSFAWMRHDIISSDGEKEELSCRWTSISSIQKRHQSCFTTINEPSSSYQLQCCTVRRSSNLLPAADRPSRSLTPSVPSRAGPAGVVSTSMRPIIRRSHEPTRPSCDDPRINLIGCHRDVDDEVDSPRQLSAEWLGLVPSYIRQLCMKNGPICGAMRQQRCTYYRYQTYPGLYE